ncbi:MAG TPA: hypothetical protein PKO06_05635 [Candidatus Ozemobacteraceae bacterium]|nr:hypothetical protein [Candidatus Ozemobacteraceae bacterium]
MAGEESTARFRIESVQLEEKNECDGWFVETLYEWRIIDTVTGTVVRRIPYRHVVDNTEWPERDFWNGPRRVEIVGDEVRAYLTVSDRTGVSFEGQPDESAGYDIYPLPTASQTRSP